jgi:peptidyl-prolyl cis-trans isomerase B (cyclophilin B)
MTPPRRRGRRVPPKGTGFRTVPPPPAGPGSGASSGGGAGGSGGADTGSPDSASERARQLTRAQNRAAKRAASGVRPKNVRGGRVSGRSSRGYNPAILGLAIAAIGIAAAVILIGSPFGSAAPSASPGASASGEATQGAVQSHGDGTCPASQPASLAAGEVKTVTIETAKGTIVMRIDGSLAPIATGNFVALAGCHFYDGIVFHRLVPGFVIQGGDPAGDGSGGPGYSIADDPLNGTYHRGTVAMARTSQPNSQGSQFFIVLSDDANAALTDPSIQYPYAIMGEVTSGMDVVDAIAAMPNSGQPNNAAVDPVAMTSVTVSDAAPGASPSTPAASSPGESAAP